MAESIERDPREVRIERLEDLLLGIRSRVDNWASHRLDLLAEDVQEYIDAAEIEGVSKQQRVIPRYPRRSPGEDWELATHQRRNARALEVINEGREAGADARATLDAVERVIQGGLPNPRWFE